MYVSHPREKEGEEMLSPFTEVGREVGSLQQEVSNLKQDLWRKADDWKIQEINIKISYFESAIGNIRSEVDSLVFRVQALEENQVTTTPKQEQKG